MSDALLVTWDGAGNLPPEHSLVRALIARGHTVRALAHESVRPALEADGAQWLPVPGLRHYDSKEPMAREEEMRFVVQEIWFARAFGSALLEAVQSRRPDLLLVDVSLTHALVAARHTRLPTVVLCHLPYHLVLGPFAPLLDALLPDTNAYAASLGVPPFASHQALLESGSLVLVFTYRSFDAVDTVAPHVVHVGPLRTSPRGGASWRRLSSGRPLVVVGLSTSHQDQLSLMQRICDALATLDVEVVVTTGPAVTPEALTVAANTTVVPFVPHDVVLPSAGLLVTHAGHGTVMAGATYGVPLLCLPMGRDQPMIAARVVELGIGAEASADASVDDIRRAVAGCLADAGIRRRAADYTRLVAGHPGLDHAVASIERLLHGP
jgi:UDP:flavonoid glycosyltransferase YjiC (YdhE family)